MLTEDFLEYIRANIVQSQFSTAHESKKICFCVIFDYHRVMTGLRILTTSSFDILFDWVLGYAPT